MTTDRHRWVRVREFFHAALAQDPAQRTAFLRDACGGDGALEQEVESLLAAHAAAGSFAEGAAIDALTPADGPASESGAAALAEGVALGPYRIIRPLGSGGMGEVYGALDTRLHREVAIKVLPAPFSDDPVRIARLQREARLLAALNHPHIATVHGLEIAGTRYAIVMEVVEGPTLADRLETGPLAIDTALAFARSIAEALEAAHEKGIIHRDLKPANIKLTRAGSVKVLDFGLAKSPALGGTDTRSMAALAGDAASRDGAVTGTPGYMSPEQARGEPVDARCDVWAFGCVVYEMLTARRAFSGAPADTPDGAFGHEPDWDRLPPDVPLGVRRMLRLCLERDPRRRIHHIGDARIAVENAGHDTDRLDLASATSASRRRARLLTVSTVVLAVALAATLAAWLLRPPPDPPGLRVAEITTPRTSDLASFALSPDGRRLAFVADSEGQSMLWVRELNSAQARALPGTERARRPFWSPDSRSIGFFSDSDLKRIDAGGGPAQTVTYLLAGISAAWGPDGTILVSSTASPLLRRVDAAGGRVEEVTAPIAASTGHRHPQVLPGGRQFLFFVGGPDAVRGVYLGSLGSSEVTRLVPSDTQGAYIAPGWLLFVRQGTLWAQRFDLARAAVRGEPIVVADSVAFESIDGIGAFSTSDAGLIAYRAGRPSVTRLSWFDRSGHALGTLGAAEQPGLTNFALSPDGSRVAVERSRQNETDLWLLDSDRQTRFTHATDGRLMRLPLWSPDGRRIAFESVRSGAIALSVRPSSRDAGEEVLFVSPEVKIPCDWSPDGKFLMYYVPNPTSGTDLWVLPQETKIPIEFLKTPANELWGQFSPDGRWVAYQSNETGRYEVYVRPFSSKDGGAIPISTTGGVYPRWSRDGTELYYIAPDANLMAAPMRAGASTAEAGRPVPLFPSRRLGGGSNVIGRGPQYAIGRDGRFLINIDAESGAPPITLLMDWNP